MDLVIAIMGADSLLGREVLEVLEPGWFRDLRLFGDPSHGALHHAGRDIAIGRATAESLRGVDIAIGGGLAEIDAGAVSVSLPTPVDGGLEPPVVLPDLEPERVEEHRGLVFSPSGVGGVVARIARALKATRVTGAALVPAAAMGPGGIEELYAQTRALLHNEPLPTSVLGGRLAFSVLPAALDLQGVEGLAHAPVTLNPLLVPLFAGTTLALDAQLQTPMAADEIAARLAQVRRLSVRPAAAPADVANESPIHAAVVRAGNPVQLTVAFDALRQAAHDLVAVARLIAEREAF